MRLLACCAVLSSCATVIGDRELVAERPLAVTAQPAHAPGTLFLQLDPTAHDSVRVLIVRAAPEPSARVERIYRRPRTLRVSRGLTWGIAAGAAGAGVIGGFFAMESLLRGNGASHGVSEAALQLVLPLACVIAIPFTFALFEPVRVELGDVEEREVAPGPSSPALAQGTLSGVGRFDGALRLSLDEAVAFRPSGLTLDGEPVEVDDVELARLGGLAACRAAVLGFDPMRAAELPAQERRDRRTQARTCAQHGWSFASRVASTLERLPE